MVAEMHAVVVCDAALLWQAWRPTFPMRPMQDESKNLDLYPLAYGLRIPVTLVAVNELRNWTVVHSLPAGRLTIDHRITPIGKGRVDIGKRLEVRGPMTVPYRVLIVPAIRRAWPRQVKELTRRANCGGG